MNEEEKKAIRSMKRFVECKQDMTAVTASEMKIVLNLLEKKDKKIEDWKMEYNHWCQLAIDRKRELEKKDKIIDEMANSFAEEGFYSEHCQTLIDNDICPDDCNKCVKQYFERKIEK